MEKIYFLNENYELFPELFHETDDIGYLLSKGVHLSLEKPLNYRSLEYPSYLSKDFYDLEALIVSPEIAEKFEEKIINGLHLTPINIIFSDNISKPYYRLDTSIEHDFIDYDSSNIIDGNEEEGFIFSKIEFDKDKFEKVSKPIDRYFFKIKGLQSIQYMINEEMRIELCNIGTSALISDEKSFKGI